MIKRSQRRHNQPTVALNAALHRQLAHKKQWHAKRLLAAGVALGISVLLWLFAVPFVWHLSLTLFGFCVGLFLPRPLDERWAFRWIERGAGLSYQALLELDSGGDTYGFRSALQERAERGVRRLEPPSFQPWWLPLLFVALILSLMPTFTGGSSPLLPSAATPTPPSPESSADPLVEPPSDEPEVGTPDETLDEDTELAETDQPTLQDDDAPLLEGDASGAREAMGTGERATDDEAISRFLEQIQEQRAEERPVQQNPFSSLRPVTMDNDPDTRREQSSTPAEADATEQEGDPGEDASAEAGDGEGEETAVETGAGAGDDGEEVEETLSSDESEGDVPGETDGTGEEIAGDPPPEGELAPGGADNGEQDPMEAGLEAGESQDGAGELGLSTPADGGEDAESESLGQPEALPGVLEDGPTSIAGTIRLPEGEVPAVSFEQIPTEFRQADEQAITEGRIPLEYQEIIRNYFR